MSVSSGSRDTGPAVAQSNRWIGRILGSGVVSVDQDHDRAWMLPPGRHLVQVRRPAGAWCSPTGRRLRDQRCSRRSRLRRRDGRTDIRGAGGLHVGPTARAPGQQASGARRRGRHRPSASPPGHRGLADHRRREGTVTTTSAGPRASRSRSSCASRMRSSCARASRSGFDHGIATVMASRPAAFLTPRTTGAIRVAGDAGQQLAASAAASAAASRVRCRVHCATTSARTPAGGTGRGSPAGETNGSGIR